MGGGNHTCLDHFERDWIDNILGDHGSHGQLAYEDVVDVTHAAVFQGVSVTPPL
jgi:hypothetical protein